jgi:hypothetical protein
MPAFFHALQGIVNRNGYKMGTNRDQEPRRFQRSQVIVFGICLSRSSVLGPDAPNVGQARVAATACEAVAQNNNLDFAVPAAAFCFSAPAASGRSQFSPEAGQGRLGPLAQEH